jgi:PAS domain S-box-containing protein
VAIPLLAALVVEQLFMKKITLWLPFVLAVIASAWLDGKRGGLIATLLSTAVVWHFFLPTGPVVGVPNSRYVWITAAFVLVGIVVSLTYDRLAQSRLQAEAALHQVQRGNESLAATVRDFSESRLIFQAVIDRAPGIIVVKDREGRLLLFNRAFEQFLGFSRDELKGRSVYNLFSPEVAERRRRTDATVIRTHEPVTLEETVELNDGQHVFLASAFPLDDERGELFGVSWIETDITARKRAEEALARTAIDLSEAQRVGRIGSWSWSIGGKRLEWSTEMYHLHHRESSRPAPCFDDLPELYTQESASAVITAIEQTATNGTPYDLVLETTQAEGGVRWIVDRGEPVLDHDGHIIGVRGISQDVTRIKELEQLREEWISVIAHDLRQPIGAIKMAAQLLPDLHVGEINKEEAKITKRVASAADSLGRMVDDLLDVSRLETNRLALKQSWVSPRSVVRETIERLSHLTRGRSVKVADQGGPEQVFADAGRIEQVLGNLISNAVKYGESNGEIQVSLGGTETELGIAVTNRGKGISADDAKRLFTRFGRLKDARGSAIPGLGLGLYIAKGLVEAHGGRMWVESVPNETTTFHITLPARAPERAAA